MAWVDAGADPPHAADNLEVAALPKDFCLGLKPKLSPGHRAYFAYGLNMDRRAMAARCPGSVWLGPAVLSGHRFAIVRQGVATVRPDPAARVHGVLWSLPRRDEAVLDAFEAVDRGLYRKEKQSITLGGAHVSESLVYVATAWAQGRPRPGYLEAVIAAAIDAALPTGYVEEIRAWGRRKPRPEE